MTPNGDGKNDAIEVTFANPQFSQVTGKIFGRKGAAVAAMTSCPDAVDCLRWDGKSDGQVVHSGVYVYVIEAEGKVFRGAVLVVR